MSVCGLWWGCGLSLKSSGCVLFSQFRLFVSKEAVVLKQSITSTANVQKMKSCGEAEPKQTELADKRVRQLKLITYASGQTVGHLRFSHGGERYSIRVGSLSDVNISILRDTAKRLLAECITNPKAFRQSYRALLPLGEFVADAYLPSVHATHRSPKTIESRVKPIVAALGHKPLNQVTRTDIETFLTQLSKTCSIATQNRYLAQFKAIMTFAVEHGVLSSSPAAGIPAKHEAVLPPKGLPDEDVKRLVHRLMDDIDDEKARLLLFLFATGCRLGEARALLLPDCNLTTRIAFLPTSKSGRERLIPLNDLAVELVQLQRERHGATGLLFRGKDKLSSISEPRRYWYRVCKDCGLSGIWLHHARHTVATSLLNAGCSLDVLQKILGHSSPKMTERYARFHDATLVNAVNGLQSLWALPSLTH
jgi:integrase